MPPGIRLQNPIEFINQPLADCRHNRLIPELYITDQAAPLFPLLLFRGERENTSPWTRPWFPDGKAEKIPSGLYIEPTYKDFNWESGNESRLLLPFSIGSNGFARSSNGIPFKRARFAGTTGLINYTRGICSVVIVVIYLGIHVAHIYTKYWKLG